MTSVIKRIIPHNTYADGEVVTEAVIQKFTEPNKKGFGLRYCGPSGDIRLLLLNDMGLVQMFDSNNGWTTIHTLW